MLRHASLLLTDLDLVSHSRFFFGLFDSTFFDFPNFFQGYGISVQGFESSGGSLFWVARIVLYIFFLYFLFRFRFSFLFDSSMLIFVVYYTPSFLGSVISSYPLEYTPSSSRVWCALLCLPLYHRLEKVTFEFCVEFGLNYCSCYSIFLLFLGVSFTPFFLRLDTTVGYLS